MKGTIARMKELRKIGYYRVFEISKMLGQAESRISETIKLLELVPFEDYYYNEYQIQLIKNYY